MDIVQTNLNRTLCASENFYYEILQQFSYKDSDLHSVTLRGCNLSDGFFDNAILADSDWDSCKVSHCIFENLSFENSDITSTYFERCTFRNVNFKGATVTDISFINCLFVDCDLNHIGLSSSTFNNCSFEKLKLKQSSTSLNKFEECNFCESKIAGNFFYNIFSNTHFKKTNISALLLASNYGFSQENLSELSLNDTDFKALEQNCLNQKDVIGAAIISLNVEEKNYDYAIWASIQVITNLLKNGVLVRAEQLLFFKAIIQHLLVQKKLTLYTVVYIISAIEKMNEFENNIAIKKSEPILHQIHGLLFEYYHEMIIQINNKLHQLIIENQPITLKITYKEEPAIPICTLLAQMMDSLEIKGIAPIRKKTAVGSFIEWIEGYDNILKCLQLIISILGLAVNFKKMHTQSTDTQTETKQDSIQNDDGTPNQSITAKGKPLNNTTQNSVVFQMPESLMKQIDTAQTENDVSKTINVFVLNGVNVNNNFQGYNTLNVRSVDIL